MHRDRLAQQPRLQYPAVADYLRSFPNSDEVKYVVMDMNRSFRDAAKAFFPNTKIIVDGFHVVLYCTKAMENVRRSFQKTFSTAQRLLLAHHDWLTEEGRVAVDVMLRFSDQLLQAYALKEAFYDSMAAPSRGEAERRLYF